MPHSSQQASRSSAEISTEILPPLWIHNLSDIASAAPKACVKIKPGTLRTWKLIMIFFNVPPYLLYLVVLYFLFLGMSYPTGSTGALISDLLDCGTVGPLFACVKAVRKFNAFNIMKPKQERKQNHCRLAQPADCHMSSHVTSCANHLINLHLWKLGSIQYGATQLFDIGGIDILEILCGLEQIKRKMEQRNHRLQVVNSFLRCGNIHKN